MLWDFTQIYVSELINSIKFRKISMNLVLKNCLEDKERMIPSVILALIFALLLISNTYNIKGILTAIIKKLNQLRHIDNMKEWVAERLDKERCKCRTVGAQILPIFWCSLNMK